MHTDDPTPNIQVYRSITRVLVSLRRLTGSHAGGWYHSANRPTLKLVSNCITHVIWEYGMQTWIYPFTLQALCFVFINFYFTNFQNYFKVSVWIRPEVNNAIASCSPEHLFNSLFAQDTFPWRDSTKYICKEGCTRAPTTGCFTDCTMFGFNAFVFLICLQLHLLLFTKR